MKKFLREKLPVLLVFSAIFVFVLIKFWRSIGKTFILLGQVMAGELKPAGAAQWFAVIFALFAGLVILAIPVSVVVAIVHIVRLKNK